ncbi:zinc-binding dehydrogenase [Micromonospora phytophila]|uniref:zinc-binding dehydrogenase n=1 Tax=Micromonospora phytophila TaxID=709888 RepID=UPI00202E2D00|nr:zinc-binding dehydrogenase [Micromonospora phytophila]MCM0673305.1 zinc-binding dehydrogenase [Micromonospora phytophila]
MCRRRSAGTSGWTATFSPYSTRLRRSRRGRDAARLQLTAEAGAERLRVLVAKTHPLREAATAHHEIMTGPTTGKIVLVP